MLPLVESSKRGPYDELSTPKVALEYLLPYIPKENWCWEMCPGNGRLYVWLAEAGYLAVRINEDSLTRQPVFYDVIVTNPPFSKKAQFLQRCVELGKPWALLLPVTTQGVRKCQRWLHDAEVIFLPRRIDFTGKKAPWFAVAWFTGGLNIGKQMVFYEE